MTENNNEEALKKEDHVEDKGKKVWEIPEEEEAEVMETIKSAEIESEAGPEAAEEAPPAESDEYTELREKYLRLYADFENYRKVVSREKQDLIKYSNEELLSELLSVIDHLELALQHATEQENKQVSALAEGVEMTLKELKTVLEKFGLVTIESLGKPFDPHVHHAMSQVETNEADENCVVTEFRKGYMLKDRVLRPSFVGVSKKPTEENKEESKENKENKKIEIEEE